MNQKSFFLFLMFFTLIISGCQEKSSSKKSSSSNPFSCTAANNYTQAGCPGWCTIVGNTNSPYCTGGGTTTGGTTTGGSTTGGSTGTGYCSLNPNHAYCSTTYCSVLPKYGCVKVGTTIVNCFISPNAYGCGGSSTAITQNPNWGMFYPPSNTEPVGSCSATFVPTGLTTALETRKATITIRGKGRTAGDPVTDYSPFDPEAPNYLNTSPMLKSIDQAKVFFLTDSVLKLRVKVKAEPNASGSYGTSAVCYGRKTGTYLPGYTKLQYTVKVYRATANNGAVYLGTVGTYETGVNNCSAAIDLSGFKENNPTGLFVVIDNVMENKNCTTPPPGASDTFWNDYGWSQCGMFNKVRSLECWSMEFEVAADGTKTFN